MLKESEPRRVPEAMFEMLDHLAMDVQPDDEELGRWFARYYATHRARLAADLHIITAHLDSNATILEYGAVPLLITAALSQIGFGVTGLDIAPQRFAGAIDRARLDVRRCDVETEPVPFAGETFDAVLFNELFEHLRINPIFTLSEAYRVLVPGGTLLLSTPNLRSWRGLRNLLMHNLGHASSGGVYEQFEKLDTLGHMGHVREYTSREVSEFLARIGFQSEMIIFRGGHGAGVVGLAERLLPDLRPFFTILAKKVARSGESGESSAATEHDGVGRQ